eukprot:scaffold20597_cov167-Amphora_coffeaeformis.AAC.3
MVGKWSICEDIARRPQSRKIENGDTVPYYWVVRAFIGKGKADDESDSAQQHEPEEQNDDLSFPAGNCHPKLLARRGWDRVMFPAIPPRAPTRVGYACAYKAAARSSTAILKLASPAPSMSIRSAVPARIWTGLDWVAWRI